MSRQTDRPRQKSTGLTLRLAPEMRALLDRVAHAERRSVTNLIEVLVERRAAELGVEAGAVSEQRT